MRSAIVTAVMNRNDYMLKLEEELLSGGGVDPMDMEEVQVEGGVGSIIAGFRYSAWDDMKLVAPDPSAVGVASRRRRLPSLRFAPAKRARSRPGVA